MLREFFCPRNLLFESASIWSPHFSSSIDLIYEKIRVSMMFSITWFIHSSNINWGIVIIITTIIFRNCSIPLETDSLDLLNLWINQTNFSSKNWMKLKRFGPVLFNSVLVQFIRNWFSCTPLLGFLSINSKYRQQHNQGVKYTSLTILRFHIDMGVYHGFSCSVNIFILLSSEVVWLRIFL